MTETNGRTRVVRKREYLTTGDIARVLRVAPRTATRWFDSGLMHGYRLPSVANSLGAIVPGDRRVLRAEVVRFAREHGLPLHDEMAPEEMTSALPPGPDPRLVVLLLTDGAAVVAEVCGVVLSGQVRRATGLFHLGREVAECRAALGCVVLDLAATGRAEGLQVAQSLALLPVPVIVLAWEPERDVASVVRVLEMPAGLARLGEVVREVLG